MRTHVLVERQSPAFWHTFADLFYRAFLGCAATHSVLYKQGRAIQARVLLLQKNPTRSCVRPSRHLDRNTESCASFPLRECCNHGQLPELLFSAQQDLRARWCVVKGVVQKDGLGLPQALFICIEHGQSLPMQAQEKRLLP